MTTTDTAIDHPPDTTTADLEAEIGALAGRVFESGVGAKELIAVRAAPRQQLARVAHCLPVSMSSRPSEATGTVLRADTVRGYADRAGLRTTVLPTEHDCWRFYRLDPTSGKE